MNKSFSCAGCGQSQLAPSFDWTSCQTGKVSRYCADCDDLLIYDQPLPIHVLQAKLASALANRGAKPLGERAMTATERSAKRYAKKRRVAGSKTRK